MKKKKRSLLFGLVCTVFIISSCSSGEETFADVPPHIQVMENVTIYSSADISSADTLRLSREQVFGDTDDEPIASFGSVLSDRFGRVYIGDGQQHTVHVLGKDGQYLGRIGREGSGPGEFQWVGSMEIYNNHLYVNDPNGSRINLFELGSNGQSLPVFDSAILIGSDSWENIPEPNLMNPGFHSISSDGSLILTSRSSPLLYRENPNETGVRKYYRWSGDHQAQPEEFFELSEPEHIVTEWFIIPPPFANRQIMTMSDNEHMYQADTAEFLIQKLNSDGEYQSAVYYPFEKRNLTREEALNSVDDHEQLRDAVQSMQLPNTWPALQQMFTDNTGRIWISVYAKNNEKNEWWVLEESGDLWARFELPNGTAIATIRDDYLYTRETDPDTGLQQVVRYSIEVDDS